MEIIFSLDTERQVLEQPGQDPELHWHLLILVSVLAAIVYRNRIRILLQFSTNRRASERGTNKIYDLQIDKINHLKFKTVFLARNSWQKKLRNTIISENTLFNFLKSLSLKILTLWRGKIFSSRVENKSEAF